MEEQYFFLTIQNMKIQSIVYFKIIIVHFKGVLYVYIPILCILAHQSAYFQTIL
jgi:hypothetical protein